MPTPEFVLALREKIGHDLLFLPGVTAVVLDDRSRVLLVRRADNGRWTLVLGCLEPGEQPAAGAVREIWEETGVTAVAERILRVQTMDPHTYPNGDRVQYFDVALLCRAVDGEAVVNDDESTEVGWFALDELPEISARERACITEALDGVAKVWFEPA